MVKQSKSSGPNIWTLAGSGDVKSIEQLLSTSHQEANLDDKAASTKTHRPDPNAPNKLGETAAHIAARQGHAPVLQLLHSHGAHLSATDNRGWTPAHHAASTGQLDCLRALSSFGSMMRLDVKDKEGKAPFDVARGDHARKFLLAWIADYKTSRQGGGGRGGGGGGGGGRGGRGRGGGGGGGRGTGGRGSLDYHSNLDLIRQLKSQAIDDKNQKGEGEGEGQKKATPSSLPLSYPPLVDLSPSLSSSTPSCLRMPRCTLEETGFTPYGLSLGWPKRPKWRGVVKSAEDLHRLEEKSFVEWQARLVKAREGMEPQPPPISFYEPRLEFWRQLWRVVEFSDIVIMIVDARNPLLHFSHALVRHVIDERDSIPILVLNKSDLIPEQAAIEWKRFFEEKYPEITVVSGSTRSADGTGGRTGAGGTVERGSASAIMQAVLSTTLNRPGGVKAKVSDLIGMQSADQVLEIARERATMTKRKPVQDQLQASHQQQQQHGSSASVAPVAAKKQAVVEKEASSDQGEDEEDEEGEEWDVKGTKMKKKLAKKKKRFGVNSAQLSDKTKVPVRDTQSSKIIPLTDEDEDEEGEGIGRLEEDEEEEEEGSREEEEEAEDALMGVEEEEMTEEPEEDDKATDASSSPRHQPNSSKPRASVVVCMVGEPNVGKSSTLNALLGVHRVAVSIHPGRTKHYQTIWMTDKLMLCDCPGLVFPRAGVNLPMQILFGSFPIARCRDPYSVVEYLAVRIWPRLHLALGLKKVKGDEEPAASSTASAEGEEAWSVQEILDSVAEKRGWKSKQGRLDMYRAANWILRQALAGREPCSLAFLPPLDPHCSYRGH